jgi:sulfur-carrier protein
MSFTITIRYFASIRELIGRGEESVQTAAVSVGQLRDELIARGGAYSEALSRKRVLRCAVNQVMVGDDEPLAEQAEIAFFPPVTGG